MIVVLDSITGSALKTYHYSSADTAKITNAGFYYDSSNYIYAALTQSSKWTAVKFLADTSSSSTSVTQNFFL